MTQADLSVYQIHFSSYILLSYDFFHTRMDVIRARMPIITATPTRLSGSFWSSAGMMTKPEIGNEITEISMKRQINLATMIGRLMITLKIDIFVSPFIIIFFFNEKPCATVLHKKERENCSTTVQTCVRQRCQS